MSAPFFMHHKAFKLTSVKMSKNKRCSLQEGGAE